MGLLFGNNKPNLNQAPIAPSAPKPQSKPLPKPQDNLPHKPADKFFGDKSFVRDSALDVQWKRNPKVREKVKSILKAGEPSKNVPLSEVLKEVDRLQGEIDINKDKSYNPTERKRAFEIRSRKVRELIKKNPGDWKLLKKLRAEDQFLKDQFGK